MSDWVDWYRRHLNTSAEGFCWAFQRIKPELRLRVPPRPDSLGTWSPTRHVWHIVEYERCLALPTMSQWVGGARPADDAWPDDDGSWQAATELSYEGLIDPFLERRQQQIALLDQLVTVDWDSHRDTIWGYKPLSMVVTKTYQHTLEHTNTLLRMALWWADPRLQ